MIFLKKRTILEGSSFKAVFDIRSSPGAFFLGIFAIMRAMVLGEVKRFEHDMVVLISSWAIEFTSGKSGPGFKVN